MKQILRTPNLASGHFTLRGSRRQTVTQAVEQVDEQESSAQQSTLGGHVPAPHVSASQAIERQLTERLRELEENAKRTEVDAYEKGHANGYQEGLRTGDAEGRDAYTSGLRQLEELTKNLNSTVQSSLEEAEDMMVSIVFESVCKIVGDTLATRDGVVAVVKEALGRARGKSALIIRVNPLDLELIEESTAFGVASEADWRADDAIPMGGCVVESEYGTLDARIDTQLNQLKRVLLAARHKPIDSTRGE